MKVVKKIFLALFVVAFLGLIGYFLWCNMTYSEGNRAGYLIKISKKGYVFKTCEGQLNLGGLGEGDIGVLMGSDIWEFSVSDNAVFEELQLHEGKKVSLHYKQKIKSFPWQGDTDYFVDEIEVLD